MLWYLVSPTIIINLPFYTYFSFISNAGWQKNIDMIDDRPPTPPPLWVPLLVVRMSHLICQTYVTKPIPQTTTFKSHLVCVWRVTFQSERFVSYKINWFAFGTMLFFCKFKKDLSKCIEISYWTIVWLSMTTRCSIWEINYRIKPRLGQ